MTPGDTYGDCARRRYAVMGSMARHKEGEAQHEGCVGLYKRWSRISGLIQVSLA